MREKIRVTLSLLLLALALPAQAVSLRFGTERSSDASTDQLEVANRATSSGDALFLAGWRFSAERNGTRSRDANDQEIFWEGRAFRAGAALGVGRDWELGLAVKSAETPNVKYRDRGGDLTLRWVRLFEAKEEDLEEAPPQFEQRLALALGVGSATIEQGVELTILNRLVQRTVEIKQSKVAMDADWECMPWLAVGAGVVQYDYDRAQSDFGAVVNSRLLNYQASDLVNTIYGLNKRTASLRVSLFPFENFDVDITGSRSEVFVDGSEVEARELVFTYRFAAGFALSLGGVRQLTPSSQKDALLVEFRL